MDKSVGFADGQVRWLRGWTSQQASKMDKSAGFEDGQEQILRAYASATATAWPFNCAGSPDGLLPLPLGRERVGVRVGR